MKKALFLLFCVMIPFENTALASIGGVFTAPLGITLIPVLALLILLSYSNLSSIEIGSLKLLFGFFVYSFVLLTLFYSEYDKAFLLDRGVRFVLLIIPLVVVFLTVARQDEKLIYQGVLVMAGVILFAFALNLAARGFINGTSFVQYSAAHSPHRMRGFTLEASTFGFQFVLVTLMLAAIYRINLMLITPIVVGCVLLITSKGTLICFLLTLFITFVVFSRINLFHKSLGALVLLLVGVAFVYTSMGDSIANDIDKYSSIATRGTAIVTSVVALIFNPLGGGFFGYLPSIYEYGVIALEFVDSLAPGLLNFGEFSQYLIVGETKSVSTKSFFFDWLIYGGVVFAFLYFKYTLRLFKFFVAHRMHYDFAVLLFLILCTTFFMSVEVRYIAPYALGFVYIRYRIMSEKADDPTKVTQSKTPFARPLRHELPF